MLAYLRPWLILDDGLDTCIWAMLTTCFWGQICIGEVLPSHERGADDTTISRWSSFGLPNDAGSRSLHLPCTKTGGALGDTVLILKQGTDWDPIVALQRHSELSRASLDLPICSYLSRTGVRLTLTVHRLLHRINPLLEDGGFYAVSGHCLCIGGTTTLLLAGVPPDIVRLLGRWSSDSFLCYWHSLETIVPLYIEMLSPVKNYFDTL